jgi:hypothetical protein
MTDASLITAVEALATALTDGTLTGYAYWPDDFGATVPAVALIPNNLAYDADSGGADGATRILELTLIFFAARVSDGMEAGMQALYTYLDDREATSIYHLVNEDTTLGGTCGGLHLLGWQDIRMDYVLTPNGPQYMGAVGSLEMAV